MFWNFFLSYNRHSCGWTDLISLLYAVDTFCPWLILSLKLGISVVHLEPMLKCILVVQSRTLVCCMLPVGYNMQYSIATGATSIGNIFTVTLFQREQ